MAIPFLWQNNVANSGETSAINLYSPSPWDFVTLGSVVFPGVCTVSATPSKRLDNKQAAGRDGATPTFVGYSPAQVEIKCKVWTGPQWEALQEVIAGIWPTAEGAKTATTYNESMAIDHPALAALRITKVVVQSITAPSTAERGTLSITVRCLEFVPPTKKSAVKTVTKETPTTGNQAAARSAPQFLSPLEGAPRIASSINDTQSLPSDDPNFTGPNG